MTCFTLNHLHNWWLEIAISMLRASTYITSWAAPKFSPLQVSKDWLHQKTRSHTLVAVARHRPQGLGFGVYRGMVEGTNGSDRVQKTANFLGWRLTQCTKKIEPITTPPPRPHQNPCFIVILSIRLVVNWSESTADCSKWHSKRHEDEWLPHWPTVAVAMLQRWPLNCDSCGGGLCQ